MDQLPNEILIEIFKYINKRDLCLNLSLVCKKWYELSKCEKLWKSFTLLAIKNPEWCKFKLVTPHQTFNLIDKHFTQYLQHVDLSKLCFSYDILIKLFINCSKLKSLIVNFKYLKLTPISTADVSQSSKLTTTTTANRFTNLIQQFNNVTPTSIEYLYLKNVCDQKLRSYFFKQTQQNHSHNLKYNLYELEIIEFIKLLLSKNRQSLKYLGFKCVDPTIITNECMEYIDNIEILLLNNIYDTDSVLDDIAQSNKCNYNLKCLEICKCKSFDGSGLIDLSEKCLNLNTLQFGKLVTLNTSDIEDINWHRFENLQYLYINSPELYILSENMGASKTCFNYFKNLTYLAINDYQFNDRQNYFPHLINNNFNLKYFILRKIQHQQRQNDFINDLCLNKKFLNHLKVFINTEINLQHLDLIGFNFLNAEYIISIIEQLKCLK